MEYKVELWDEYMTISLEEKLNELAEEGWRLILYIPKITFVFERELV